MVASVSRRNSSSSKPKCSNSARKTAVVPSPTPIVGILLELDDRHAQVQLRAPRLFLTDQRGEPAGGAATNDDEVHRFVHFSASGACRIHAFRPTDPLPKIHFSIARQRHPVVARKALFCLTFWGLCGDLVTGWLHRKSEGSRERKVDFADAVLGRHPRQKFPVTMGYSRPGGDGIARSRTEAPTCAQGRRMPCKHRL